MTQFSRRQSIEVVLSGKIAEPMRRPKVIIWPTAHPSPLEQFAAKELSRILHLVFGPRPETRTTAPQAADVTGQAFLLGLPATNPAIAAALARRNDASLEEQEYLILPHEIDGVPVTILTGGSPAAVLWAVYELAEYWGVTFLTDREIIPAERSELTLPTVPVRCKPAFTLRAWRGLNQLPHSGAYWGLQDYVKLIDQLAKMRFNCFSIADGPNTPLIDFTWAGVRKSTAALSFGWRYPIRGHTIGRKKFNGETWFQNPDVPYDGTYEQKVAATKQLIKGIRDHAVARGMRIGMMVRFTEFSEEFKQQLREQSLRHGFTGSSTAKGGYVYRLGVAREGADPAVYPFMTIRNPHYVDLVRAQLEAYFQQCAGYDVFILSFPEFNNACNDADFAWHALAAHHQLGDIDQLQTMVEKVRQDLGYRQNALSDLRIQQLIHGHICNLYLLDELFNRRGLKSKYRIRPDQLIVCLPSAVLGALSSKVLGPDMGFMIMLGSGYQTSEAAKHVDQLKHVDGLPATLNLTLSLEDDNIGLTPQFTAPSLHTILSGMRRHGAKGVWCRQWLLSKLEHTTFFLSHACWDDDLTPGKAYDVLIQSLCGEAAVQPMLEAFALGEQITLENDEALNIHSFLVPKLLARFWEDGAVVEQDMLAMRPKYQQLVKLLRRARSLSQASGRFFIDRFIGQSRFAEHWITTMQKLQDAVRAHQDAERARQEQDIARMDERLQASVALLDESIQASRKALRAWAHVVSDRADLGALAALNEYGYRYLLAIRHVQFIRSNYWECQLSPPSE